MAVVADSGLDKSQLPTAHHYVAKTQLTQATYDISATSVKGATLMTAIIMCSASMICYLPRYQEAHLGHNALGQSSHIGCWEGPGAKRACVLYVAGQQQALQCHRGLHKCSAVHHGQSYGSVQAMIACMYG